MKYTITVDDDDREEAGTMPWTAVVLDDGVLYSSGVGRTPGDALRDLAAEFDAEHKEG